ncbi:hypothetical protein ACO1O0_001285 [Amphichorda felina]
MHDVPADELTVKKCIEGCADANFILAGVEYGGECYCGNTISNGGKPADAENCDMTCKGNKTELCGGSNHLNLYDFELQYSGGRAETSAPSSQRAETNISPEPTVVEPGVPATTSSSGVKENPTECPYQPVSVGSWNWYGCYTEATGTRALSVKTTAADDMTISQCAEFCDGYAYFGVEYSRECFCGNKFNTGSVAVPASQCNMICGGSECNYCGAGNRLSVYTIGDAPLPSETPGTPTPTDVPEGWDSYGCWVDSINGRILAFQAPDDAQLTLASCVAACADRGYTVAGAEYYTQCFCGNEIINGGAKADDESQCSTPCGGDADQKCGGPDRMSIFSMGEPAVFGPPGPIPSVGDWIYQGCAQDNIDDQRTFPWQLIFEDTLTPKLCTDACAEFGYMAAGLEYGIECYCGDPANMATTGSKFVDDEACNIPCAGNGTAMCGGGARLTTYFWEGDPFYSWDFPEGPAAGRYQFLIGGVVIPLMTSQAINGKVTFVEKWGTGPPNSTGAYELDLSVINDFGAAWRTMHVKTDVFCAGGVTLPDKAGRQLVVGGWSGDSTFGVRLYTPDGSAGVKGKNDWEENVDVLSLQDGRWYPSAMNMANGSVLVVGGEEGSNGAPVPTLEILPSTGTPPLYMEWLERTDPNNLYPYLAVLPSGGIFVAYWNEARILDEVTFDTIKTLPNIPGAVNDPLGGRTYPLEGTAVLLPQHAPYNDDLGVLICGGSTEGPATALDNCVTIYPDAAKPEWVIERMPSRRVISCMAPLPDGTYLILNGAQHGVAGFGLAERPNLNALLYDPTKAVGSRISVMANTTVARLYHSEAITLLDGRVLVSGSDPQDGKNPQEYRVEVFVPPYLLGGDPRPTFKLDNKDWDFEEKISFTLGSAAQNGAITASLLGSVSSTHGNSMGSRTLFPAVSCTGTKCTVTAPPGPYICTPGWYQFFVLDGGIPAVGVFVRIGGDPASIGNWPKGEGFTTPGV